jgi:hypothetical protein
MEYYSAIRNNDMWFESKWMQLEDIMLSEVSQVQKDKDCIFSLICGRQIQKINKHDNIQILMFVIVELLNGTQGNRERKRE